jgi:hypothetical protein
MDKYKLIKALLLTPSAFFNDKSQTVPVRMWINFTIGVLAFGIAKTEVNTFRLRCNNLLARFTPSDDAETGALTLPPAGVTSTKVKKRLHFTI